jgi:hypothetical protein
VSRSKGYDYARVNADEVQNVGKYSFYVTYIAKGGSSTTTSEIILNAKCAVGATHIVAPTIETP